MEPITFKFSDGKEASTYIEVLQKLKELSQEEYETYIHDGKNGFVEWINHRYALKPRLEFHDPQLAPFTNKFACAAIRAAKRQRKEALKKQQEFFDHMKAIKLTILAGMQLHNEGTEKTAIAVNNSLLDGIRSNANTLEQHKTWQTSLELIYDRLHLSNFIVQQLQNPNRSFQERIGRYISKVLEYETRLYKEFDEKQAEIIKKTHAFVSKMQNDGDPWNQVAGENLAQLLGATMSALNLQGSTETINEQIEPQMRLIEKLLDTINASVDLYELTRLDR